MAQAAARFATEVAPPQVVSVLRRRKTVAKRLDTIAEDDREQLAAYGSSSLSDHVFAAAWSFKTPPQLQLVRERTGGFTRDLSCVKCLSDAHGCQASGHRRAVHAQELYKVRA